MSTFVHEWFAANAAAHGSAIAIDAGARTLTYDALERASNRLAHAIAGAVPRGSLVAILAQDSVDVAMAMIAILKAGCAFVPMDPSSSAARLDLLAGEIDLMWWVADPALIETIGRAGTHGGRRFCALSASNGLRSDVAADVEIVSIASPWNTASGNALAGEGLRRQPDDLCYVYFTSGSTGRPKGIAGRLKAIDQFVRWEMRAIGLGPAVRVSQLTSPVFDAFLRDIFLPLCAGGVVCVPPDRDTLKDARRLAGWLRDSRVNVVHCVPSLLRSILSLPPDECRLPDLTHVLTSGEPLLPVDVQKWMARWGAHARLFNLYGPSETTMVKFAYEVTAGDADRKSIPIGTPIDGARAIVVNERGKVCPPGVAGEIYIRTPYRSLGYYGRPDLTAEVFIQNPFGSDPDDLVYRTGDLARVLEDGVFEFLGRRDQQVKIRGVRVELAEIENAIRREPRVQDCAVIDRDLEDGSKTLRAFIVPGGGLTIRELAARAGELLPEYMMPAFVAIDALPRTATGKVDRQALLALAIADAAADGLPRTPVEEIVAATWAGALGVERVHIDHDIFQQLGGHSLLATQVLARLQPLFDVPLKLRWLFDAPTVAGFSACIEEEMRLSASPDQPASEPEPVLEPVRRDGPLPASFGQERLWVIDQVTGTRAYHVPLALALTGPLDERALRAAVIALAERHEVLRTTIDSVDGRPVQRIAASAATARFGHDLPWIDLCGLADTRRTRAQRRVQRAIEAARFDLRDGPLWRVAVVRLDSARHMLSGAFHHITTDGWSIGVLLRDLAALYDAARSGAAPLSATSARLPALAVQYADYAVWQRRLLSGARLEAELAYWRTQLAGVTPLELPTDRPRPAVPSGRGALVWRRWPSTVTARVRQWGSAQGATLFMVLVAAWQAVLARYAGQQDVAVGVPVTQRPRPELEPLIGFFLNTVVLRTQVRGGESWRTLVAQVRSHALAAYTHQLVPFEQVIQDLQPERDLTRTPLFQVLFALQNLPAAGVAMSGTQMDVVESDSAGAKFDLELGVKSRGDDLTCRLEYATDLFDRATAERLLAHVEHWIDAALATPDARLDALPLLTNAERTQIVDTWNATEVRWPANLGTTLTTWLERQAARTPHAAAVWAAGETWSYARLHADANRLARRLRRLGVRPEARVGVWLERSPRMVAALLGVLKSGGAYVPLDPSYPAARLASQVADACVSVVLTEQSCASAVPAGAYAIEVIDEADAAWTQESSEPIGSGDDGEVDRDQDLDHDPGQLAYVIYTSGSTGQPKGAMNTHAGVLNRLAWMQAAYDVTPADRVLQKTSISFDVSVWELFLPLGTGATLVLARPGGQQDPVYLAGLMTEAGVTMAHFVPAMLEAFVAAGGLASCDSVRLLVSSGEALPGALASRVTDAWPGQLENLYGPTEAAVDVTRQSCDAERGMRSQLSIAPVATATVPIGRPVANTQIYVVDRAGQPVPIGVVGELLIGGVQVGRGYWAHPALTAERFVPDAFGGVPGARLYRTGDLARYDADGTIGYLGRVDQQVKLRGYRIELGEIEAALRRQAGIRDAAVALREDAPGERRLVAYVVLADPDEPFAVDEVQHALQTHLPDAMVPAAFVTLPALPLTPSGKVDRRQLPAPGGERPSLGTAYAAPRSAVEGTLTRIWADVLRLPQVGIHDNFFALGGDSILSLQIVARAREAGVQVLPPQMFQFQTIAELALAIGAAPVAAVTAWDDSAPAHDVALTPVQRWFFDLQPHAPDHFNQAVLLAGGPELPAAAWAAVVSAIVAHHDALRLRFTQDEQGEWRQSCADVEERRVFLDVDLSAAGASSASLLQRVAQRVQQSLNLADGPILRAVTFRGPTRAADRVLIVIHHAAVDGVSWRTLVEDLYRASAQWSRGLPIVLPPSASFLRWAEQLQARSAALDAGRGTQADADAASATRPTLPRDWPDGANTIQSQRAHSFTLTPQETLAFLQQPPRAYRMQAHEVLIAAVAEAVASWIGSSDARLALEGHGREALGDVIDVSRTIGCFTSLFPVQVSIPPGGPRAVLRAVKEQLFTQRPGGATHMSQGTRPAPEVLVNYFGQFDQVLDEAGWRLTHESAGRSRPLDGGRPFILEINGGVVAECLRVTISYSGALHRPETIALFADAFAARLRRLVSHCQSVPWTQTTPSDVPMAALTQEDLDRLAMLGGEIEDAYPLSPMQEGLLFHSVFEPEHAVYFQQFRATLEGDLDVDAFRRAWGDVIARHAILRTAFVWEDRPRPLQVVYAQVPLSFDVLDLRGIAAEKRPARLDAWLAADRRRGFRLDRVPLLRLAVVRVRDQEWQVVWSYHHILIDGWCVPLVFKEVALSYEARRTGGEASLEPVGRFRQYIAWLQRQDAARAKTYWRRTLEGFHQPTAFLPPPRALDDATPPVYDHRTRTFSEATVRAVQALARQQRVTMNTVVQGAWALLLSRYAGTSDVVFGATSSGRPTELPGVEAMIGLFINTLPVRVSVAPRAPIVPWLQALQAAQVEARQYEYTPLADIQAWSDVPRGLPLFESLLAFENYPVDDELVRGQASFRIAGAQVFEKTNYPVTVQVSPASGLSIRVLFDGQRLDGETTDRLLAHVERALAGLADRAQQRLEEGRLDEVSLIDEIERERVLRAWTCMGTGTDAAWRADWHAAHPDEPLLVDALDAQARATPDAIAIVAEGEAQSHATLSYATLHARAEHWARRLQAEGVAPEVPVAVCLEPGLTLVTLLLAVWKAGGVYVPLEPRAPSDRLSYIGRDVGARVLVTTEAMAEVLGWPDLRVVCIDRQTSPFAGNDGHDLAPLRPVRLTAEHMAYVIYTSGSTGRPKGVAVTHGNVTSLLAGCLSLVPYGADDVWTWFHSAAFDFSVWEMWAPLHTGGRVIVVPPATARAPESFAALVRNEQVTVLNQTPSAFRSFIAQDAAADTAGEAAGAVVGGADDRSPLALRSVIFGGEALDPRTLRDWVARHGLARPALINMYGITETTVHVTYYRVTAADVAGAAGSRIGRALRSLQVYVRDAAGQLAPVGVDGEMYVGGGGVARGYIGRPELTAERFAPDPFSGRPGARLYRTGDRARWQADGQLEYGGRLDHQVKLRGYRIEPGEIEAVLRQHSGVRDAIVLLRDDTPGERRLVAYVVPEQSAVSSDVQMAREWEQQQVEQWEDVFDRNYAPSAPPSDPVFNIAGWNSSETGLPIPASEMREWVDETIGDIMALRPSRVLEIGCGTGLLLLRVAPHCQEYCGTDISRTALDYIERQLAASASGPAPSNVTLRQQRADDLSGLDDRRFDVVILNSVVQYFPSAEYLTRVLQRVVPLMAPGGAIYLGDIRSLPLLRTFHESVQWQHAPGWLSARAFHRRVERLLHQEGELVLAPEFFLRLPETLPAIALVDIRPKLGRALNEMTRFRYQAVLHVRSSPSGTTLPPQVLDPVWSDWTRDALSPDELRRRLRDERPAAFGITDVPNVRLRPDLVRAEALARADEDETMDELRASVGREVSAAVHPRDLLAAGSDEGYEALFDWARHGADGAFDVVFVRGDLAGRCNRWTRPASRPGPHSAAHQGDEAIANSPLLAQAGRHLEPVLRRFAQDRLPGYMVPAAFVVLDRFPITSNGKLDRRALPPPDFARPELEQAFVAARTPLETELAQIWAEILRVQQVGVHDNFFELGGDSIISIQLVARANRAGVPLTPKLLFEHQTIAQIAAHVQGTDGDAWTPAPPPADAADRADADASRPAALLSAAGSSAADEPRLRILPRDYVEFSLAGVSKADFQRTLDVEQRVEDAYPLSPMQQGMLFHSVDAPESGVYVAQLRYTLGGHVRERQLRAAWRHVVARHASLRTAFVWDRTAAPLQLVFREVEIPWEEHDWRDVPENERHERFAALLDADRRRGFDLTQAPLMRLTLIRTHADRWELIWSHHHLLLDGWSLPIVSRELVEGYESLCQGFWPEFPPPVPYVSYIAWLLQQDAVDAERYWRGRLQAIAARSPFAASSRTPIAAPPSPDTARLVVPVRKTAALKRWARTRRLTLNTLVQGLWSAALSHMSASEDVIFGGVVSGRPPALPGSERCVGLFINTLPVRVQVPREADVVEWLLDVQTSQAEQRQYEFVPLVRVKSWSDVPADAPLFETLLVFENFPIERIAAGNGASTVRAATYEMTESFPLVLAVGPGRQLALALKYDRSRVDDSWVQRLRAMLDAAFDAVLRGEAGRVDDILQVMRRAEEEQRAAGEAMGEETVTALLGAMKRSSARRSTRSRHDESGTRTAGARSAPQDSARPPRRRIE